MITIVKVEENVYLTDYSRPSNRGKGLEITRRKLCWGSVCFNCKLIVYTETIRSNKPGGQIRNNNHLPGLHLKIRDDPHTSVDNIRKIIR